MRRLLVALAGAIAIGGCNPAEPPPAPPPSEPAVPPEPRADLPDEQRAPDLYGTWLVEEVSTAGPVPAETGWNTVLLVGVRQLEVLSQCITIGPFDYGRTVGGGIAVSQAEVRPPPEDSPAAPAPVTCARALTPAEQTLGPTLLAAREVKPESDGRVTISGPRGSLIVRRPAGALPNPRGAAPPPPVPPLLGAWRFVSIAGRQLPAAERMELLARPKQIEWRSGCVSEVRGVSRDRDLLVLGKIDPFPVCERGRSPSEDAVERLFDGPIATRMSRNGELKLEGSGVTADLEPLTR